MISRFCTWILFLLCIIFALVRILSHLALWTYLVITLFVESLPNHGTGLLSLRETKKTDQIIDQPSESDSGCLYDHGDSGA